ncbi:MAG: 4Fe-4S dicluster domain-containing protein [Candidatus Hermodarchaeota archaeon]
MVVIDYEFKKRVMDVHIKDILKNCYQCNRCTDECPVAKVTNNRYRPRPLILNAFLGLKDSLFGLESNFNIWGCTVCDTCDEVCPQKIELTEVFYILKNISIARGEGPDYFIGQASAIYDYGKAIPSQPAIERRREQLGLPIVQNPSKDDVQKLLTETKLIKLIKKE